MSKFVVIAKKASFWEVVDGKQKRISKARFDAILSQKIVSVEYKETETIYHVVEREEVELFSFAELSKATQNTIIAENRYNWFEHLKALFHQTLELLGFSNIHSRFTVLEHISFTADWDARNIVNDSQKWQSQQAYESFAPFMRIMCKLGGKAKIADRCYITADSVLDELVLEEMYNNICYIYGKLLVEYTKNGLCVNKKG